MGWVSFLEDIQKRVEELDLTIERIKTGEVPYVDGNRAKVVDIAKHIRVLVGDLQGTLRKLSPEDSEIVSEIVSFKERISSLSIDKERLEKELKSAYEMVAKLKEDCDDEKKKLEFIVNKFRNGGPDELRSYLRKLRKYP